MIGLIGPLISLISSFFGGLFTFKGDQAKTIQESLETLQSVQNSEGQSVIATAHALNAIFMNGSFLERNWRAAFMIICMTLLVFGFFGVYPPHFNDPLSPMMGRIFDLLEIGLGGYIVRYGVRDIVRQFNIAAIIKTFIEKKVL